VTTLTVGLALAALLQAAQGAGPRDRAEALRHEQSALASRSRSSLLGLYALDSRLARASAEVDRLRSNAEALRAERARVAHEIAVARRSLHASEAQLGDHLRRLYEDGQPDALAVVLGASSVEDALSRLDSLRRSAHQSERAVTQTLAARDKLSRLATALAAQAREADELAAAAEQTAAALAEARAVRVSYLSSLASQRRLNAREIVLLDRSARAVVARAQAVEAARATGSSAEPSTAPASAPAPRTVTESGASLTVTATGYSLPGHTATGLPVGWGVVAVEPSVMPMGTRFTIPGYGEGVAADVGRGVQGAAIDLWFPTQAQALAWGRRTVTITVH